MKRILSVIMCAVILCGVLAACGKKTEAAPLTEVYAALEEVTNMPQLDVMPDALIETLFGFDLSQFEEYVFAEAADPAVYADTVIIVKLAEGADLNSVCSTLDGYLSGIKENTRSYSPENYAKTEKSSVTVVGDYVYLIVTEQYEQAVQIVSDALSGSNTDSAATAIEE